MSDSSTKASKPGFEQQLQEMNEALLLSSLRQHGLTEQAEKAERAAHFGEDRAKKAERDLRESEERYRAFIKHSTEGIWRFELEDPIPVDLPTSEQLRLCYEHGHLAECNDAMARQYGYTSAADIAGARLTDFLVQEDPKNVDFLRAFIESGYQLIEAESNEKDTSGSDRYFLNNFVGIVENGFLLRAWGTRRDITETKVAADATARLAAIVVSSEDAIISKDLMGKITSWNVGATKMFGYRAEEVIGKPITILMPPERVVEAGQILKKIRREENVEHFETVRRRRDGTDIVVSLTVSPIRNAEGNVVGASKIVRDITERKRIEETIHHSQAMLTLAMQSSRMGVWELDLGTNTVLLSEELEEIFGLEKGSFGGTEEHFYELMHEHDRDAVLAEVREAVEEHRDSTIEFRFHHADGSVGWMECRGEAVYSQKDEPVRMYGVGIDITQRKEAEKALRESEERFSKAFSSSPLVFTLSSLNDGRLVEVNDTFVEVTGYSRDEAIGKTSLELGLWAETDDRMEEMAVVRELGQVRNLEYRFRTRSGGEIIGLLSAERIEIGDEPFALTVIQDITDRKRAEEQLSAATAKFQSVFNQSGIFAGVLDLDGYLREINDLALDVCGYGRDEVVDKPFWETPWWRMTEGAKQRIKFAVEAARSGKVFREVLPYWWADGTERISDFAIHPIRDQHGNVMFLHPTGIDITDKKRADDRLRESELRFRNMADHAPVMIWVSEDDGECTYLSESWYKFTGQTSETGLGHGWLEAVHPDERQRTEAVFMEAHAGRKGFTVEYRLRRKAGGYRWAIDSAQPRLGPAGEFLGYIGSVLDIHDRREAEAALIKAERKAAEEYQALLSRIVPLAAILGRARDLTSIYGAVREFICISMKCSGFFVSFFEPETGLRIAAYAWGEGDEVDIAELPPMRLTPEGGGANSRAVFEKRTVITNHYWDEMKNRPHVVLRPNGIDPMSSLIAPMMIKDRVLGTLEVQAHENEAFDQDDVVALEMAANLAAVAIENVRLIETEASAREAAEAANRAKDEFLSVLSHELRTPLNAMLGWVRMLKAGVLDEENSVRALEVIERNTRLQGSLIEDLLDVSRIISGKMRIETELVDLVSVVETVSETIRPLADAKGVTYRFQRKDDSVFLTADAVRLQQVVSNLLQNSIKFTPAGGSIEISLERNKTSAVLRVSDTGVGIETDLLPHIFDRFRQADASARRNFTGLGLGLTIVRNIVDLHGGTIDVHSDGKDRGSVFILSFPLAADFYAALDLSEEPISEPQGALAGKIILLVDDDAENLLPVKLFLESEKADVTPASSAVEALEFLAERDFHLMIADIGMPDIDGYELVSRLRADAGGRNAALRAIALTAYASVDDRERALGSGFQAHLPKPVDFDELLSMIERVLRNGG